jgi:hypothetical protein
VGDDRAGRSVGRVRRAPRRLEHLREGGHGDVALAADGSVYAMSLVTIVRCDGVHEVCVDHGVVVVISPD